MEQTNKTICWGAD